MTKKEKTEAIYRTALKLFARYGFKKTTVEDIASELGLSKGTLYLYSSDKQDLYRRTVAWAFDLWQERVRDAVSQCSDPVSKLKVLTHESFSYLAENQDFQKVLACDPDLFPVFSLNDPYEAINHRSIAMLQKVLQEGADSGVFIVNHAGSVAKSLFSVYVLFIQKMYVVQEGNEVRMMYEDIIELITRGLLADRS